MVRCSMGKRMTRQMSIACLFISLLFTLATQDVSRGQDTPVKIGVLAKRGPEMCLEKWSPTAEYLTASIPDKTFEIVPLDFDEIHFSVKKGELDFILANSSIYVELETWYGVSRIATLKNLRLGGVYTEFGGVIFCKANRADIRHLSDLKGKTFMGVEENSLGGWRMAWRELKEKGVDPYRDFAEVKFGGTHDVVVHAVRDGKVDAGTVRTDTLERMEIEGKIAVGDFYVIHEHKEEALHLSFLHSTRAYPEWPFAKIKHTPDELAEKVAVALLEMPRNSAAAKAARCAGWTIPLNYQPVHQCLKELKLGPYKDLDKITPLDIFKQYWRWILAAFVLFLAMASSTFIIFKLNRNIKASHVKLQQEVEEHKQAEEALRQNEEKYRTLFENAAEAIYVAQGGKIRFPNPKTEELYGYSAEELTSKPFTYFIHQEDQEMVLERYKKRLRGEAPPSTYPFRIINKTGDTKWVEINSVAFSWDHRPAALCFLTDITERKWTEEALLKQTHALGERVKELNCLYSISRLLEKLGISLEKIVQRAADLTPPRLAVPGNHVRSHYLGWSRIQNREVQRNHLESG